MKKYLISRFNDMKIQNKLVFSFLIVVIVPVLIVGVFLTTELRQMALNNAITQTENDMDRIKKRTAEFLATPVYTANNVLIDQRLKDLVNTNYESTYEVVAAYKDYGDFENVIRYNQEVEGIRFYFNNPTLLNNWTIIPDEGSVNTTQWYQMASIWRGLMGWFYIPDETLGNQPYLSLVRAIYFAEHKTSGMLVISINTSYLNWILSQEQTPTMIVDAENNIVATNQTEYLGFNLRDITNSEEILSGTIGRFEDIVFDLPSQIIVDRLLVNMSFNDLRIMQIIPDSLIVKDANHFGLQGLTVIGVSIFVALVLIYFFSFLISKRFSQLSHQIQKVEKGDLNDTSVIKGNDEVAQLSNEFHRMRESIKTLIKEVEEKNNEKRKMEKRQSEIKLKMLASQINPHFLFNALESIRMKAHMQGEKDLSQVVKKLGKLLRRSLDVGGGKIPLANEIDMVKAYLDIQRFRFEDRLDYTIDIETTEIDIKIPPLIIQPLIENAVIHGLEKNQMGGHVTLNTKIIGNEMIVNVIDNGTGISDERKNEIFKSLSMLDDEEDRIGLRNVHERLILTYGPKYGLSIDSKLGHGTCVSFKIPIRSSGGI